MTTTRVVFLAFAKEDEAVKNLFLGQRKLTSTPYDWTDMSVKEPYLTAWKERVRTRVRRSDGVIALISSNTPAANGELWEISCAVDEAKPLIGVWIESDYRIKPAEIGASECLDWTWENVGSFIDSL